MKAKVINIHCWQAERNKGCWNCTHNKYDENLCGSKCLEHANWKWNGELKYSDYLGRVKDGERG